MKCEHCPLKDRDIPCMSDELEHRVACDAVNPGHPKYKPDIIKGVVNNSIALYNKKHNPELIKPPSFIQKVVNVAGAVQRIAEEGYKEVSEEIYNARLSQCDKCAFKTEGWVCSHPSCGCFLTVKAKLSTEACPIGKWGVEFLEDLESEEINKLRSVSVDQIMKESIIISAGKPGGGKCCGG